ncbi:MAG: hypothetical protein Q7V19_09875 [Bacteroidales bacterium]|nr:hypothetical protein [Bacteroidales bacterium]
MEKDNEFTIPQPSVTLKSYYERLSNYEKEKRTINGHEFLFVTEQTRKSSKHACTVNDLEKIIDNIPQSDYGKLRLIVLRQPKKKEETLSPVWGRLVFTYSFEESYSPAIIIEAIDFSQSFKWAKGLSTNNRKELERLRGDGHLIIEDRKYFTAEYKIENVRNTQLYRTLLHEFGHYVHYFEIVEQPEKENEDFEEREKRENQYFKLPKADREKFAHSYAERLKITLTEKGIIPFERTE